MDEFILQSADLKKEEEKDEKKEIREEATKYRKKYIYISTN